MRVFPRFDKHGSTSRIIGTLFDCSKQWAPSSTNVRPVECKILIHFAWEFLRASVPTSFWILGKTLLPLQVLFWEEMTCCLDATNQKPISYLLSLRWCFHVNLKWRWTRDINLQGFLFLLNRSFKDVTIVWFISLARKRCWYIIFFFSNSCWIYS